MSVSEAAIFLKRPKSYEEPPKNTVGDKTENREGAADDEPRRKMTRLSSNAEGASFHTPDSGGASSSSNAAPTASVPRRFNFDDDDFEFPLEPDQAFDHDHDVVETDGLPFGHDQVPDELNNQGSFKKRRLRAKTNPVTVPAFPLRALVKAKDFKVLNSKLKQAKLEQRRQMKSNGAKVINLLAKQMLSHNVDDEIDVAAVPLQTPHFTHYISALAGNSNAILCKACACWSLSEKLRGLASPCNGMKVGNKSTLRLLQCGVMPGPQARLPLNAVKLRRRKNRW